LNRWSISLFVGLASLVSVPLRVAAQPPAESGLAKDASTGAPLECLHVALVDTANRAVAHTVTDPSGTFVLVAPGPGTYRVRFEVFGWQALFGPLDSLAEGAMHEREYPLSFANSLMTDDANAFAISQVLRQREDSSWRSAALKPGDVGLRYPEHWLTRKGRGQIVSQYIVNTAGTARLESLRIIEMTHKDFAEVFRKALPRFHYAAAQQSGAPVCELVRARVLFENGDRGLRILVTD
jgi:hypothetical protein